MRWGVCIQAIQSFEWQPGHDGSALCNCCVRDTLPWMTLKNPWSNPSYLSQLALSKGWKAEWREWTRKWVNWIKMKRCDLWTTTHWLGFDLHDRPRSRRDAGGGGGASGQRPRLSWFCLGILHKGWWQFLNLDMCFPRFARQKVVREIRYDSVSQCDPMQPGNGHCAGNGARRPKDDVRRPRCMVTGPNGSVAWRNRG